MAKQRKQKQRDGKGDAVAAAGPSVTLRHQKLCVAIDVQRRRLEGYTELTVACTKGSLIGLSTRGLNLKRVLVDDKAINYDLLRPNDEAAAGVEQGEVLTPAQAADAAYARYTALLQLESVPDVLIPVAGPAPGPKLEPTAGEAAGEAPASTVPAEGDPTEEVKLVWVEYWVEDPELGAYFSGDTMHVNTQQRHARWWFPCMDSPSQRCSYDMEFTVDANYFVVSCGELLHQVSSPDNSGLKTFAYHLGIPTAANFISLVVAPLEEVPDRHNSSILHYCMPGGDNVTKLECTISLFHSVFSWFEEYVGAPFPYACYKHVFINTESAVSSVCVSASVTILSSYLLFNENIIDQAVETRLRLASALAQQWFGVYITPEAPSDAWLLEGLAGFLTDLYIKRTFGNNDACYRQHKANEAVCRVDIDNVPPLSLSASSGVDLYGTEKYGSLGKIRAFKSFAIVQMLEKQMGPDSFRKILQRIIIRTHEDNSSKDTKAARTLSTKEFRHFAMKIGNLERPFLKDFFPRWVESQGCPILRLGYSYNKRRNMVELAVQRDSTASSDTPRVGKDETDDGSMKNMHTGWPGMMSVRIHELDGMYDHPSLPMAGDPYQLLELQCHSKLAGRRVPRPKKGSKVDPNEDIVEIASQNLESPLLWLRADPGMEYLAEIHLYQSEQMWINQLERERDVAGQVLAINELRALPRPSFAVVTALSNCLNDSKVFCRVRIEAASALASTATETTNWAGLSHLIKFYKNSCFDLDLGLPKPNDFQDVAEYFVLQAIPGSVAAVRGSDGKSPPEAAEFVLHILKHNDNSGNMFSDVFWLASVIESVGNFAFGQQTMKILFKIVKQIDHYLQYDRIVSSFNGLLTTSCIRTLTKLSLKLHNPTSTSKMQQILLPLKDAASTEQKVRVAALRALLDIECLWKGYDAAVSLAMDFVAAEPSIRVQSKVFSHLFRTAFVRKPTSVVDVTAPTLISILRFLDSKAARRNVQLRHATFGLLQVLAGRPATLYRLDTSASVQAQKAHDTPAPAKTVITPQVRSLKPRELSKPVPADSPATPMATLRLEPPRRIRLVNNIRPGISKEAESTPTHSASSSGGARQIDDKRTVGKVKLRLKPSLDVINQVEAALNRSSPGGVGTSPVPDEAHSRGRSDNNMPADVVDGGRRIDTRTKEEEDFQGGQGLMRLLTDDSPVRRESMGFGSGLAGGLHGAQIFRDEGGGSELELGEIPSDKPAEGVGVALLQPSPCADGSEGNVVVPGNVTSPPTGEKSHRKDKKQKKEKKEKKDKDKKEKRDKKEKKDKESKLKQDQIAGDDKDDKHDKKEKHKHKHKKKRKHQDEEGVADDGAGKADKKRKREEEESYDGKKHRSEKKKLKATDPVATHQGAQGPSDPGGTVGSVTVGAKPASNAVDTGGESNKGNPDSILRLRIKKF